VGPTSRAALAAWIAVGLSAAGCSVVSQQISRPAVPDAPQDPTRVGPAVLIGSGADATSAWRAWVYRTADGSTCLEVNSGSSASTGCGPGADAVTGIGVSSDGTVDYITGGTQRPGATAALVMLATGDSAQAPLVAAPVFGPNARYFATRVPTGSQVDEVRILDAAGTVLETLTTGEADPRKEPPAPSG